MIDPPCATGAMQGSTNEIHPRTSDEFYAMLVYWLRAIFNGRHVVNCVYGIVNRPEVIVQLGDDVDIESHYGIHYWHEILATPGLDPEKCTKIFEYNFERFGHPSITGRTFSLPQLSESNQPILVFQSGVNTSQTLRMIAEFPGSDDHTQELITARLPIQHCRKYAAHFHQTEAPLPFQNHPIRDRFWTPSTDKVVLPPTLTDPENPWLTSSPYS